ncbi:MAG: exopolyphosphatase [Calditrichaeota bacterium]|nr:exopolyphosphatase [Calditrichota bacterium]
MVEDVDGFQFIEPDALQHGEGTITSEDIIANLPYRSGCGMWFDHHTSNTTDQEFRGSWWVAPSAARVIYEYYSDGKLSEFEELVEITDRIDSATINASEIRDPQGYFLISMTIHSKQPNDEPYWIKLVDLLKSNDLKKIMADEDVRRRCDSYCTMNEEYGEVIGLYSDMDKNVLITDFRRRWHGEQGNRFLAFSLFPECDIWVKVMDHPTDRSQASFSVGRSIFKHTSELDVGELLAKYGGGGHKGAGGCRVLKEDADRVLKEIVEACKHEDVKK